MLKLMKYEFRKQAFSKIIILFLIALIELVFFAGVIFSKENFIGISLFSLTLFAIGAMFYIAFESILTYSNDLKQKCSYMLFLTPNTSYSIVGAKVLSAALQIILSGLAFFALAVLDAGVLVAKYNAVAQVKELIETIIKQMFKLDVQFSDVLSVVILIIATWIFTVTVAFFSITLSTTFLADKKYKGILSFVIFIIINIVVENIIGAVLKQPVQSTHLTLYFALYSLYILCFTILSYFGTAWMLDKKVSV